MYVSVHLYTDIYIYIKYKNLSVVPILYINTRHHYVYGYVSQVAVFAAKRQS